MSKYRKLFAALVITAAFAGFQYYGVDVPGLGGFAMELIQIAVTGFGVYQVPNEQA